MSKVKNIKFKPFDIKFIPQDEKIELLKKYFEKEPSVVLAFLFGSRAKGLTRKNSDWDIAVYFKPKSKYLEWEERDKTYSQEEKVWRKVEKILEKEVDLVVLNRAPSMLVFSILSSSFPLVIKDRYIFLDLLEKTSYEAIDFRNFIYDFWKIKQRSKSLSREDKARLLLRVDFLESELGDFEKFQSTTEDDYCDERDKRRNLERWIENLMNASLDISKIILASEKKRIPETYREIILELSSVSGFEKEISEKISGWVGLRNILAHEYLDIRWVKINDFLKNGRVYLEKFLDEVKRFLEKGN